MACCGCNGKGNVAVKDVDKLDEILSKYEGIKGSLISILQDVQGLYEYLPEEALNYVSEKPGFNVLKFMVLLLLYSIQIRPCR